MSKNRDRNLEALSRIDEEIVEWSGKKRVTLKKKHRKSSRKKWYIMGGSLAAAAVLILSTVLILISVLGRQEPDPVPPTPSGKQVPVYQGMTVSNALTGGAVAQYNSGNGNENDNNGNHYGQYKGDYKHDQRLPEGEPFPDKPLSGSLTVLGSDDGYYAKPGEDIYITVHLSNPDKFEILSFTLNGEKYSSYMFEDGSDLENLILKVNVGQVEGMISYTIDAIKYVDGEEIKDVRMEGDQTVEIGVYTEKQPTVTVSSVTVGFNSIGFSVAGTDEMKLIEASKGKVTALLYNGDTVVAKKEISLAETTTVTFDDLAPNTLYQYAIVADYDALDGKGYGSYILEEQAFYTKAPVLFDGVTLTTTGIDFALDWHAEANGAVQSVVLSDGTSERVLDTSATAVTDLLPAADYTLTVTYKNGDRTETIMLEFTTAPLTYTVNHLMEKLDGTYEVVETFTDLITYGATVTPEVQTHEGFTSPTEITITGQTGEVLEVNYKYERTTYTLTFVRNDGAEPDTLSLKYGHEIPGDTRDGFGGWFRDADLTEAVTTVPAESLTLYAKWEDVTSAELLTYTGLETLTVTGLKEGVTLSELSIPSYIGGKRVTAIADRAFNGCAQLAAVTVPATVERIGQNAFGGCSGLGRLTLPFVGAAANGNGATYFGYIFGAAKPEDNNYYVPSSLKSVELTGASAVGDSAFMGCTWLENVSLGSGIPSVGASAFAGCTGLNTLNIATDGALATIGESAFSGCAGLKSLTVPENVTSIGASAFENCTGLTEILFNAIATEKLSSATFSAAGSAGEGIAVTFGAKVTKVPQALFAQFSTSPEGTSSPNIKSVSFAAGSVCTEIGRDAFFNCVTLSSLTLPNGLEKINIGAFNNNDALTELTIPASVTEIGNSVFGTCALLETVRFGEGAQLQVLGHSVFYNCPMLKNIDLPGTLISIGNSAFNSCALLNGVILPTSLESIGNNVFSSCVSLSTIVIPADITSLGTSVFRGCTALKTVEIKGNIGTLGSQSFYGCSALETVEFKGNIKVLGDKSFYGCTALTEITLPETLTEIGVDCFRQSGLTSIRIPASVLKLGSTSFADCKSLESVSLTKGLRNINGGAFSGCSSLQTLTVPDTVTFIGITAFAGCAGLVEITLPFVGTYGNKTAESDWQNPFGALFGTAEYEGGVATVQSFYGGKNTQTGALSLVTNTYYIPAGLTKVTVTGGNILRGAFRNCKMITELTLPEGLLSVGQESFMNCSALTEITLPETLTEIGIGCFVQSGLTSIRIPASVTTLGASSFSICKSLESVSFAGNKITVLPASIFASCEKLTAVEIPNGVTTINGGAFNNCTALQRVTLPASVAAIGQSAFTGCTALNRVDYTGTLDTWMDISFANVDANPIANSGKLFVNDVNIIPTVLTIAEERTVIKPYTFYGCTGITELNVHAGVTSVGTGAFGGGVAPVKAMIPSELIDLISTTKLTDLTVNTEFFYDEESFTLPEFPLLASLCFEKKMCYNYSGSASFPALTSLRFEGEASVYGLSAPLLTSVYFGDNASFDYGGLMAPALKEFIAEGNLLDLEGSDEFSFSRYPQLEVLIVPENTEIYAAEISDLPATLSTLAAPISWWNNHYSTGMPFRNSLESLTLLGSGKLQYRDCDYDGSDPLSIECPNLKTVTLSADIAEIASDFFGGCIALTDVYFEGTLEQWFAIDFANEKDNPCYYADHLWIDGEDALAIETLDIAATATSFGANVFTGFDKVSRVNYVGTLSDWCKITFANANANPMSVADALYIDGVDVTSGVLTIPETVTSIGDYAFYNCTGITELNIHAGVSTIGTDAFGGGCAPVKATVPMIVLERIGKIALQELELLNGTALAASALQNCTTLKTAKLPDTLTSIGTSAFSGCTGLTKIEISNGVTTIGAFAFSGCTGLAKIEIPNSVTTIGAAALGGCSGLQELMIPFVGATLTGASDEKTLFGYIFSTTASDGTVATKQFYDSLSSQYKTYYIPAGLKTVTVTGGKIATRAFHSCSTIETVYLDDVTEVLYWAFYESSVKHVYVSDSVTNISDAAFRDCPLETILVDSGNTVYKSVDNCLIKGDILWIGTANSIIPDDGSVTSIASDAFNGRTGLKSLVIPSAVTSIGTNSFYGCSSLYEVYNLSVSLTITVGSSDNGYVGYYAQVIHTSADAESIYFTDENGFTFIEKDGAYWLIEYVGERKATLVLPSDCKGSGYYIEANVFESYTELVSLTIPEKVLGMGKYAFAGCVNLTEIYFNAINMADCSDMKTYFNDVFHQAGVNGNGITLYIGASVERIPAGLFVDYTTLVSSEAASFLPKLTAIVFADNSQCESIGASAFYFCAYLTEVDFGENSQITTIDTWAFYGCGLQGIVIPASVTQINAAFRGCQLLTKVTFENTEGWVIVASDETETAIDVTDPAKNVEVLIGEVVVKRNATAT